MVARDGFAGIGTAGILREGWTTGDERARRHGDDRRQGINPLSLKS